MSPNIIDTYDILKIVEDFLRNNDYDGLFSPDGECACLVDDLAPCGSLGEGCTAGWKISCRCGEHDYHISLHKEKRIE